MSGYDIIISGPITGVPDYIERFAIAYANVRQSAFRATGKLPSVWNPAELPPGRSNEWYMRQCVDAIFDSPNATIVMLPDWHASKGARAEHALAVCLGLNVEVL